MFHLSFFNACLPHCFPPALLSSVVLVNSQMSPAHVIVVTLSDQWAQSDYWWTSALDHRDNVLTMCTEGDSDLEYLRPQPHVKAGCRQIMKEAFSWSDSVHRITLNSFRHRQPGICSSIHPFIHQPFALAMHILTGGAAVWQGSTWALYQNTVWPWSVIIWTGCVTGMTLCNRESQWQWHETIAYLPLKLWVHQHYLYDVWWTE